MIEDEPSIIESLEYVLRSDGVQTVSAQTIAEGIQLFHSENPDIVILDIGLPDGSGLDACKEIRKASQVPVLFLTARQSEIDKVLGLELGGDDYVTKPFSPREVAARIKAILRRTQALSPQDPPQEKNSVTHSLTSFKVDDDRKVIYYQQNKLDLSRTEYRLLQTLLGRPGKVFSRDELMNAAWDDPGASLDRTVDAHVKSLRSKLRSCSDQDVIVTHRGLGYSLNEVA